jgi:predicted ABC-type transport system involved in lysophospholipase L1 biosynthesis ATPase subunit
MPSATSRPGRAADERPERPAPAPAATRERAILSARGIRKSFAIGERELEVLHGVHLDLARGELLCLMGASGAGKSTLMHVLGMLERPTEGEVWIEGQSVWQLPIAARAALRNRNIGFVFQFYHLLSELDALENVLLPAMIGRSAAAWRKERDALHERARSMLDKFGLGQRLAHRPAQLSGGERQRVAIARALFLDPPIVIADEPTGNLDSGTGERVLDLLFAEQAERGLSLLLVTHDERVARRCERIVHMDDGQIQADSRVPIPE